MAPVGANPVRRSKLCGMSTLQEIEDAVRQLSPQDLAAFRSWFAELDAAAWDRQIEDDIAAGRLEALADEALDDLQHGRCSPQPEQTFDAVADPVPDGLSCLVVQTQIENDGEQNKVCGSEEV